MTDARAARRLADLQRMTSLAAGIVEKGEAAYVEDSLAGATLRLAGRQLVIQVATVAERLPDSFKSEHDDVEWVKIQRMRNLIAHHYDRVLDEFVWESLRTRLPDLSARLGLGTD